MISAHLPILQVVIPLLAAPLTAFMTRGRGAFWFAAAVTLATFVVSLLLWSGLPAHGISYSLGGWAPPIGIEYRIDALNAFILMLVSGAAAVMMPFAFASVGKEVEEGKQSLFYAVYLLMLAGMLGMVATNDIFNIYVFLEIASLATYALVAMGQNRKALTAAYEYLIQGTIGATFFLIGVGFLYFATGTLNITDMANRLAGLPPLRIIDAGVAFLLIGLALKIAYFPLHSWLVNSYTYAPSFISAFLAAAATKVSIYLLLRLKYSLFESATDVFILPMHVLMLMVAVIGIVIGSLAAMYQENIKRMFAFSSVANIGYLTLGIAIATPLGLTASLTHFYAHALAKAGLFLALGCLLYARGSIRLKDMAGIMASMPVIGICFIVCGLSLIGIPGTVGFISKWLLLTALLESKQFGLIVLLLVSSLLAVVYVWKVVEVMLLDKYAGKSRAIPVGMTASLLLVTMLNVLLGFYASPLTQAATLASEYVFGVIR